MKKLTIILGAGFSFEAGLPLGKDIQARFDRELKGKLLLFSSGEWMWTDGKNKTDLNNGSLNYDYMAYSYVLNEYVKDYKLNRGSFMDYEDFYQFIIDTEANLNACKLLFKRAKSEFLKDNPSLNQDSYHLDPFKKPNYYRAKEILNYLIWDMLRFGKTKDELLLTYKPFVDLIKEYDKVDIFTLNHDTLVEFLLEENNINYTKGFSKVDSNIQYEEEPLETYQGYQDTVSVRLYKMHGSTDCYQFEHCNQNGGFLERTGKGTYYLPNGYRARHTSIRIDPKSGDVLQDYSPDPIPKFITGKDKTTIIKNDYMYSDIYNQFFDNLKTTDNLLISGYSYRDDHVNEAIKDCRATKIINQNPFDLFPFKKDHFNINKLEDINSVL
ncbi:SIR2-like domain-containing protein [Hyunsoonleella jejuensis]|uniref:SIR2-like domain-containing protein n=1 Tax=Hyunsoonleella jejuensis TaxID=419940 RepID=A0A1H9CP96_9FLAO|nr:SIR2 family protein [Hyunsoonleella jejuensis]SEQ03026.1 SIR2-like domain-containing protein [Hyunsoonleella jejuensis]